MTSGRMRRVDEAIRQVIGEVVAGELKDPRVGFVTVTDVRTSADLSHARVYVSVLERLGAHPPARALGAGRASSEEPRREATLAGLRSAHGYVQRRVASELRLKRTPTLDFIYDDTTDRAMRLEELLDEPGAGGDGQDTGADELSAGGDGPGARADGPGAGASEPEAGADE
jgi:ribosome-binding factor A